MVGKLTASAGRCLWQCTGTRPWPDLGPTLPTNSNRPALDKGSVPVGGERDHRPSVLWKEEMYFVENNYSGNNKRNNMGELGSSEILIRIHVSLIILHKISVIFVSSLNSYVRALRIRKFLAK